MNQNKTRGMREGAMMVALTAVLILVSRYVPIFSMFSMFFCGIPMAALSSRNGFKVTVPALVAVILISIFVTGDVFSSISLMFLSVLPGAVSRYGLGKKYPFFKTHFACCIVICLGWILELLMIKLFIGKGFDEILGESLKQTENMMRSAFLTLGENTPVNSGISPDKLIDELIKSVEQMIRLYLPSFVLIGSMVSGYVIMRLCGFIIRRAKLADVDVVSFSMMKAPTSMVNVALISYILYVFSGEGTAFWSVLANAVFILYTIVGFCGLSFVDYKFREKIKSGPARLLVYILIFFLGSGLMPILSLVLIGIGIFDSRRNYRNIGF